MSRRGLLALVAGAIAIAVAACAPVAGSGGRLEGTEWVLRSYMNAGTLTIVPEAIYADAEFDSHVVTGQAGCNPYRALYQAGGRTLRVSQIATTLMACDQASMDFEQAYTTLLDSARFYGVRNDTLTVFDGIGSPVLVYDAAPRNPLLGTWVVDSYLVPPSTITAPIEDTKLFVTFGIAKIGGSSGCNQFSGIYGTNGNAVWISQLAVTQMACDPPVMDQETAFLAALKGVSFIDYRGSSVQLQDARGSLVIALVRPEPAPEASPSPSASAAASPTASPSETPEPTETPTPKPTATPAPTATPTPTPTTPPTANPTSTPSSAPPSAPPSPPPSAPPSLPATASCDLHGADGTTTVATLVYPGTWHTLAEPPELACRYFDPAEITVPSDPSTLKTAVTATLSATAYADAVTGATDPATWTVLRQSETAVGASKATCVAAVAVVPTGGISAGSPVFTCVVDLGTSGTVALRTVGTVGDAAFAQNAAVVALMTQLSTFTPGT